MERQNDHQPINSDEIAVVEEQPRLRAVRNLGSHAIAFEGFEPMGIVESQYAWMKQELESKIIDQPEAVKAITEALERSAIRMPTDKRAIANLAFLGPTGVGKSETAKVLAELLGRMQGATTGNLIKIDCSNYQHGHEIATLTGSPPGYVDGNIEPMLSRNNIEKPGTVILFDEIEKGSPELYNLMLQITGDGELKMSRGTKTSFHNTIIILTSNLGAKEMSEQLSRTPFGLGAVREAPNKENLESIAKKAFKKHFRPEFSNRLDKLVLFQSLTENGLGNVLEVKLSQANIQYEKQLGIRVSLSDAAKAHLVEKANLEPENGARPVVRAFENDILTKLGSYVGGNHIPEGTHIKVFHISEAPEGYEHNDDIPLIFARKTDTTIKKARRPLRRKKVEVAEKQVKQDDDDNEPVNLDEDPQLPLAIEGPKDQPEQPEDPKEPGEPQDPGQSNDPPQPDVTDPNE